MWRNNSTSRSVTLAVWDDAVGSWVNLKTYPHGVPTPTVQTTETFDLTPYISANTQIRFLGSGSSESTSYIYFDNVEIAYTLSGPPATNPGGPPQPPSAHTSRTGRSAVTSSTVSENCVAAVGRESR